MPKFPASLNEVGAIVRLYAVGSDLGVNARGDAKRDAGGRPILVLERPARQCSSAASALGIVKPD